MPHPSRIMLTGQFEAPLGPTAAERAVRASASRLTRSMRLTPHALTCHRFGISNSGATSRQTRHPRLIQLWHLTMIRSLRQTILKSPLASLITS
jgi:hypothetical protein